MQCGSCGNELPNGVTFCPKCGAISSDKVSGASPDDPTAVSSSSTAERQPPIPTNYGYGTPQNPYEQHPYSSTPPPPPHTDQQNSYNLTPPPPPPPYPYESHPYSVAPPAPPTHRGVMIGFIFGVLAVVLILMSVIGIFVWFPQRATNNTQSTPTISNTPTISDTPTISNTVSSTSTTAAQVPGVFDTSFYYRLTNSFLGSGQSLDVRTDSSYLLKMSPTGDVNDQFWRLVDLGSGKYALRTAYLGDGYSLDVINDGVDTTPHMAATGNYTGQYWSLVPWGDGTYKLTNDFTGPEKSLDTYSGTYEPFLDGGDHSGQHWVVSQLAKITM